jgi:uncharacterized protein with NAD-binding domain and iron-sulfur cluster
MGGGVGGLMTAFYLVSLSHLHGSSNDNSSFDITVIERNSELGGQARSKRTADGQHSEYCWHAFGSYQYMSDMLRTVTDDDGVALINHLVPVRTFLMTDSEQPWYMHDEAFNGGKKMLDFLHKRYKLSICERARLLLAAFKLSISDLDPELDNVPWPEYVRRHTSDERVIRWISDSTSIILGMDYAKLSTLSMIKLFQSAGTSNGGINGNIYDFACLDGPMNEIIFDNLARYLTEHGVTIRLNTEIKSINVVGNLIHSVSVGGSSVDEGSSVDSDLFVDEEYDWYVNSLDADTLGQLVPEYFPLAQLGKQLQVQVTFYVDHRTSHEKGLLVTFVDSPWFLMTRVESTFWEECQGDVLAVGIGIWDVPGILYNKPASKCTREELARECWEQMKICYYHSLKLPMDMPTWNIWDSYVYVDGSLTTYEPKFSNNVGTYQFRPDTEDKKIGNLLHATAYTRVKSDLFNMETASDAAYQAAKRIIS